MKATKNIFRIALITLTVGLLASCEEDATDKLTGKLPASNAVDLSARISGFDSDITGEGAQLTATGSDLSEVLRVMIGGVLALNVESAESTVSFTVPTVPIGMQDVVFIFSGSGRAYAEIEVVPIPVISYFDPISGGTGDLITIYGSNLNIVDAVQIAGVSGNVVRVAADSVQFEVPAGASKSGLTVVSDAGSVTSAVEFISCEEDPTNKYCLTPVNTNGDFEAGTLGIVGAEGATGGNWFLAGNGTRATYEIIEESGYGLGRRTLKVSDITSINNFWEHQVVNDGYEVPAGKRFIWFGRVWSDADGRLMRVAGGVSVPGYQDMLNTTDFTLVQGWNLLSINTQHDMSNDPPQLNTQVRAQMSFGFAENAGATFLFDDMRVVVSGDWVDCSSQTDLFFDLYNQYSRDNGCPF
ncbi:MAG: IPT/TIG domain-containing protein [Marinoscillum sp.]|uniref:IPT/TIG domain-containing protein n=3 Tax=Marinoscillum sp. TaxID=2024838 RepID=UPI0032F32A8F